MTVALLQASLSGEEATDQAHRKPLEGHSIHGDSFSEGPRQEAVLLEGMGNVHFEVSTTDGEAQKFFDQGVGQLHGFLYFEAERSFRQVLKIDADCAMAYWGIAMANIDNEKRATDIIAKAADKKDGGSERERKYIEALSTFYTSKKEDEKGDDRKNRARDLVRAYENIVLKFPEDLEAKAFLLFQIWHNSSRSGVPIASHLAVDGLARQVFASNPLHPAHHYVIHLWDNENAENALTSAAQCGQMSAGIAHMWHMPGHTYSKLKRYADAAWQQEASARVDHAQMVRSRIMPDQIHNYTHNNGWLIDNYACLGRVKDAVTLAMNMIELPRIPRSGSVSDKPDQKWSTGGSSYSSGRERLFNTLAEFELWDEVMKLSDTPYLEESTDTAEQVRRDHLLGLAHLGKGQSEKSNEAIASLQQRLGKEKEARFAAADAAEEKARNEKKTNEEIEKAMVAAMRGHTEQIDKISDRISELEILRSIARGDLEQAKKQMEGVEGIAEGSLSRIHLALGDNDKAVELAKGLAERSENQIRPLANYAYVLHRTGKNDEAKVQFEKLRDVASWSDMDLPVLDRVKPLAESLGYTGDWRKSPEVAKDTGVRPDLNTLGPLRWHPSPAPSWTIRNVEGDVVESSAFAGRPHIMIFYLGKGCIHCMEQLQAFAPVQEKFAAAELPILAIGTDSVEGIRETFLNAEGEKTAFPFPLYSDVEFGAFKVFRAYD
ncbi:MAG: redoxin domain-containing protein, partial [Verrucomicrobia bacterium]|nr:redoxin domain-containing protein [Verrucomicrobiota bacterium]